MAKRESKPSPGVTWLPHLRKWSGPLSVAACFVALAHWSWLKWPEVFIDFGQQLYLAWRLRESQALYRDLAYFNGPLAPHVNAAWFGLFGVGLRTLVVANLINYALMLALLHRLLRLAWGRGGATAGVLAALLACGFNQLSMVGNYNFITPYSHDLTQGLLTSMAGLALLAKFLRGGNYWALAGCGLLTGLTILTKAEVAAACVLATIVALITCSFSRARSQDSRLTTRPVMQLSGLIGYWIASAMIAPLAMALWLIRAMPWHEAISGMLSNYASLFGSDVTRLLFFRNLLGLDAPVDNFAKMLAALLGWLALFAILAGIGAAIRQSRRAWWIGLLLALCIGLLLPYGLWREAWRALPAALLIILFAQVARFSSGGSGGWRTRHRLGLALWSFACLGKIILHARVDHYGFALAMPAVAVCAAALAGARRPAGIAKGRSLLKKLPNPTKASIHAARRGGTWGLLIAMGWVHVNQSNIYYREKSNLLDPPLVERGDAFLADDYGIAAALALQELKKYPAASLAVWPDGSMINYLARRRNPTQFTTLMPTELAIFGEEKILRDIMRNPPDLILLVHHDTSEYGFPLFGKDYAREIMNYVRGQYRPAWRVGEQPLEHVDAFGLMLLKRRE